MTARTSVRDFSLGTTGRKKMCVMKCQRPSKVPEVKPNDQRAKPRGREKHIPYGVI